MVRNKIKKESLTLLLHAPSSFGALYRWLILHSGFSASNLDVASLMNELSELEQGGLVVAAQVTDNGDYRKATEEDLKRDLVQYEAWLRTVDLEEFFHDEIGLWYEITKQGREEWKGRFGDDEKDRGPSWMIDDLSEMKTIIVQGETLEVAEDALRWWLSRNPEIELLTTSRSLEPSSFTLRNDTVIKNGVKLQYSYRLPSADAQESC